MLDNAHKDTKVHFFVIFFYDFKMLQKSSALPMTSSYLFVFLWNISTILGRICAYRQLLYQMQRVTAGCLVDEWNVNNKKYTNWSEISVGFEFAEKFWFLINDSDSVPIKSITL